VVVGDNQVEFLIVRVLGFLLFLEWRFANKISFKRTWTVVPFQSFAIAVPQFQTMFLFAILVAEIVLIQKKKAKS
jgi:hypothetical protein